MQFTALPLLALAASASAAIAKPGWNVTSTYRPISQQATYYDLTLVFVSDDYPAGIKSQCTWSQLANPTDPIECNPSSVSIERPEGHITKITQTFENGQTLYGSGDVPSKGHVVIDVNAGIA